MKPSRASERPSPRGPSTCPARKSPVSGNQSCNPYSDNPFPPLPLSRRNPANPTRGRRKALPARFQHMAQQKQSGEPETILQILIRPAIRGGFAFTQEARQPQQPVAPGLAGRP